MEITVSIITPCYNAALYLAQAINSVLAQTYREWELLIVDDCSTDGSYELIQKFASWDTRIKYFRTDFPSGSPTLPRNIGVKHAKGRFIAFLDSDDIWLPDKLKQQIPLFEQNNVAIVYANYEKITDDGIRSGRLIKAPIKTDYKNMLYENVIGCLTAVYDVKKVGKIYFPNVRHEDFIVWLDILKKGFIAVNTNTVLALYREQKNSLSANKFKAFSWTWNIYRNVEHLNVIKSCYCFCHYAIRAGLKYLK